MLKDLRARGGICARQAPAAPNALATLNPDDLNTLVSLMLSPLLVIGSLTTFIVGLSAFASWLRYLWMGGTETQMAAAVNYGIARAFVVSLAPSAFTLLSALQAYHHSPL
jgi:hypothetical protein